MNSSLSALHVMLNNFMSITLHSYCIVKAVLSISANISSTSNVGATPAASPSTISDTTTGTISCTTVSTISASTVDTIQESAFSTISTMTKSAITDTITEPISDTSFDGSSSTDSNMKSLTAPTSTATTSISPNIKTILTMSGGKRKQKILWRDENAPKAPLSAYLQFLNKTRETLRAQNPGMSANEVTKFLGTMWSEMPLDKKQVSKLSIFEICFLITF